MNMQSNAVIPVRQDVAMSITTKVMIDKTMVAGFIKEGKTKEWIRSTYYPQLNRMQWQKALVKMKLNNVRAPKIDFEILEDSQACAVNETCEENNVAKTIE